VRKIVVPVFCALLVAITAQPVLAYQYRENVPVTEVQCEDEGPYHNIRVFVRFRGKGTKAIWLRCGKEGKKGWGYYHIEENMVGAPFPKRRPQKQS
jgi:hypothetical protein